MLRFPPSSSQPLPPPPRPPLTTSCLIAPRDAEPARLDYTEEEELGINLVRRETRREQLRASAASMISRWWRAVRRDRILSVEDSIGPKASNEALKARFREAAQDVAVAVDELRARGVKVGRLLDDSNKVKQLKTRTQTTVRISGSMGTRKSKANLRPNLDSPKHARPTTIIPHHHDRYEKLAKSV